MCVDIEGGCAMVTSNLEKQFFFLVALLFTMVFVQGHNVAVIGTGYVGLVTGAGLAEVGHTVICADIDEQKINQLRLGIIPIYEPGLAELVERNVEVNRLFFTTDIAAAILDSDVLFIAVGTPMSDDGQADMRYVYSVVDSIAQNIKDYKVIVTKSTVPVGTGKAIRNMLQSHYHIESTLFSVVSNPEFLREGSAVQDFLFPDRIVIGSDDQKAIDVMRDIYRTFLQAGSGIVTTNLETSELIKYAANAFLALKLTSMNQVANLCDNVGADANIVALGIGLDPRIGQAFLKQGPGYGGSCFPKDTQALVYTAQQYGQSMDIIRAVITANEYQKTVPITKLKRLFKTRYRSDDLYGKTVAILGLAFKGNTDDIRYSPSITMIEQLCASGATVHAYDPVAMENMKKLFPDIVYFTSPYDALRGANALIIATEWDEFKMLDFTYIKTIMHDHIIVDARNIIDPGIMVEAGFLCDTIGQSYLCNQ